MKKSPELFISLRYIRGRRGVAKTISFLSGGGVAIGVLALIVTLALMRGFEGDIRDKVLGANAHLIVFKSGGFDDYRDKEKLLLEIPDVIGVNPFVVSQGMLSSDAGASGVVVYGIFPHMAEKVLKVDDRIIRGRFLREDDEGLIVIGNELAGILGVSDGDDVILISPKGRVTPFGFLPKAKRFKVAGIFSMGMYDYDSSFAFLNITDAQNFFDVGDRVSGIQVSVRNPMKVERVAYRIDSLLGFPYFTRTWKDMNRNLFSALKLERIVMFLVLILIILVATGGIVINQIMTAMEKRKEVGILMSIGATRKEIMKIFFYYGAITGIAGTLTGAVLAVIISLLLSKYHFISLPSDVYYISTLPVDLNALDILVVCLSALFLTVASSLYPAIKASKTSPGEVLRYE